MMSWYEILIAVVFMYEKKHAYYRNEYYIKNEDRSKKKKNEIESNKKSKATKNNSKQMKTIYTLTRQDKWR